MAIVKDAGIAGGGKKDKKTRTPEVTQAPKTTTPIPAAQTPPKPAGWKPKPTTAYINPTPTSAKTEAKTGQTIGSGVSGAGWKPKPTTAYINPTPSKEVRKTTVTPHDDTTIGGTGYYDRRAAETGEAYTPSKTAAKTAAVSDKLATKTTVTPHDDTTIGGTGYYDRRAAELHQADIQKRPDVSGLQDTYTGAGGKMPVNSVNNGMGVRGIVGYDNGASKVRDAVMTVANAAKSAGAPTPRVQTQAAVLGGGTPAAPSLGQMQNTAPKNTPQAVTQTGIKPGVNPASQLRNQWAQANNQWANADYLALPAMSEQDQMVISALQNEMERYKAEGNQAMLAEVQQEGADILAKYGYKGTLDNYYVARDYSRRGGNYDADALARAQNYMASVDLSKADRAQIQYDLDTASQFTPYPYTPEEADALLRYKEAYAIAEANGDTKAMNVLHEMAQELRYSKNYLDLGEKGRRMPANGATIQWGPDAWEAEKQWYAVNRGLGGDASYLPGGYQFSVLLSAEPNAGPERLTPEANNLIFKRDANSAEWFKARAEGNTQRMTELQFENEQIAAQLNDMGYPTYKDTASGRWVTDVTQVPRSRLDMWGEHMRNQPYTHIYDKALGRWIVNPEREDAGGYPGGYSGEHYSRTHGDLDPNAMVSRVGYVNPDPLANYLAKATEAAQAQINMRNDYAVQQAAQQLRRALEDANAQYQTERDQAAIDERNALDNQVLYSGLRGDKGGIGKEQYGAIQNAAAQNRANVNAAQTKLSTDTARQVADLRAKGEFNKADGLLSLTQSYLSDLMKLDQWAQNTNLGVDEFNTALEKWEHDYRLNAAKYLTDVEFNRASLTGRFPDGTPTLQAQLALDKRLQDSGEALLGAGIMPTVSQLSAMGLNPDQASAMLNAAALQQAAARRSGSGGTPRMSDVAQYLLGQNIPYNEAVELLSGGNPEKYGEALAQLRGYEDAYARQTTQPDTDQAYIKDGADGYYVPWEQARTWERNGAIKIKGDGPGGVPYFVPNNVSEEEAGQTYHSTPPSKTRQKRGW